MQTETRTENRRIIADANAKRDIADWSSIAGHVKRVVVVLCASRSGSSMFKRVVARSPDIITLDGEVEPYLTLTHNGFGFNSDSDALRPGDIVNLPLLRSCILDELLEDEPRERYRKRFAIQFPDLPFTFDGDDDVYSDWLKDVNLYGHFDVPRIARRSFAQRQKIEEPPFVWPSSVPACRVQDLPLKTLLLKTPQDVYRPGLYERVFPEAEVIYLHLTRSFAATVNGLIDGWMDGTGFFAHWVPHVGWWKFDMPPNWRSTIGASIDIRAFNQWEEANRHALEYDVIDRIKFEDLLTDRLGVLTHVWDTLGVRRGDASIPAPATMVTAEPRRHRWKDRETEIMNLISPAEQTMLDLGYTMEPETWI